MCQVGQILPPPKKNHPRFRLHIHYPRGTKYSSSIDSSYNYTVVLSVCLARARLLYCSHEVWACADKQKKKEEEEERTAPSSWQITDCSACHLPRHTNNNADNFELASCWTHYDSNCDGVAFPDNCVNNTHPGMEKNSGRKIVSFREKSNCEKRVCGFFELGGKMKQKYNLNWQ